MILKCFLRNRSWYLYSDVSFPLILLAFPQMDSKHLHDILIWTEIETIISIHMYLHTHTSLILPIHYRTCSILNVAPPQVRYRQEWWPECLNCSVFN